MDPETVAALLRGWREDIAQELQEAETILAEAQARLSAERIAAAEVAAKHRMIREVVSRGIGKVDPISNALSLRVESECADGGPIPETTKREIKNIEYRISDLQTAIAQIDRALHASEPQPAPTPEPGRVLVPGAGSVKRRLPEETFDPLIT